MFDGIAGKMVVSGPNHLQGEQGWRAWLTMRRGEIGAYRGG
jgi:hypothetical protein